MVPKRDELAEERADEFRELLRFSSLISRLRVKFKSSDLRMDFSGIPQLPTSTGYKERHNVSYINGQSITNYISNLFSILLTKEFTFQFSCHH